MDLIVKRPVRRGAIADGAPLDASARSRSPRDFFEGARARGQLARVMKFRGRIRTRPLSTKECRSASGAVVPFQNQHSAAPVVREGGGHETGRAPYPITTTFGFFRQSLLVAAPPFQWIVDSAPPGGKGRAPRSLPSEKKMANEECGGLRGGKGEDGLRVTGASKTRPSTGANTSDKTSRTRPCKLSTQEVER